MPGVGLATEETKIEQFDYVIVGAGSAGCVLANKLTANPETTVLLVESGPADKSPFIHMPRGFGKLIPGTDVVWHLPLTKAAKWKQPEEWVRGRTLGGSSSVNGMIYMRGFPADYDAMGLEGWSWREFGPIFKAMEDHELGEGEWRGVGGPLHITLHPDHTPLCEAIIEAASQTGIKRTDDVNAEPGESVGYQPRNIWRGKRQSAAVAFLDPIRSRRNLTIVTETDALRVVFDGKRASGVELRNNGQKRIVKANREVILSAGTVHSAKLLQLSGIGPAQHLASLGIPVLRDAPVGEHLIEQRDLMPTFHVSHGSDNAELQGWRVVKNALKYALFKNGVLSNAAFEIGALVKTRPDLERPDAQLSIGPYSFHLEGTTMMPDKEPGAVSGCYVLHPKSEGTLKITSPDPDAKLHIDPNYLDHPEDQRASIDLIKLLRKIFAQPALRPYSPKEIFPGPDYQSDEKILEAFQEFGTSALHSVGSCRMSNSDENSVVDTKLRVRGFEGLRVVDISVLPTVIAGNTNAAAMAIGWRASQLILDQ